MYAVPYDMPIPGYNTNNVATIRLWASRPKRAFDLSSFNAGQYDAAVAELNEATLITRGEPTSLLVRSLY